MHPARFLPLSLSLGLDIRMCMCGLPANIWQHNGICEQRVAIPFLLVGFILAIIFTPTTITQQKKNLKRKRTEQCSFSFTQTQTQYGRRRKWEECEIDWTLPLRWVASSSTITTISIVFDKLFFETGNAPTLCSSTMGQCPIVWMKLKSYAEGWMRFEVKWISFRFTIVCRAFVAKAFILYLSSTPMTHQLHADGKIRRTKCSQNGRISNNKLTFSLHRIKDASEVWTYESPDAIENHWKFSKVIHWNYTLRLMMEWILEYATPLD